MLLESIYKKILLEGSRDNALIPVMQQYGIDMSLSQFKQVMLRKLAGNGLRNLSLGGNFYLLGAIMYYLNGDLTENTPEIFNPNRDKNPDKWKDVFKSDVCYRLNALILILRNRHVDSLGAAWEQPEDFGNLPLNKLLRKYNSKINNALGIDKNKPAIDHSTNANNGYTYEVITKYEQCPKYGKYCDWCITQARGHYNNYTIEARNEYNKQAHFIIFKQIGFEDVPEVPEEDKWIPGPVGLPKPQDTFGNSLIAVLQDNQSPDALYITSRWNHGYKLGMHLEADHAYTTQEFLNLIGCDESILKRAYDQWIEMGGENAEANSISIRKEKMNVIRDFKYAQMSLNGGNIVENIFKENQICTIATGKKGRVAIALVFMPIQEGSRSGYATLYDRGKLYYDDYLVKVESSSDGSNLRWLITNRFANNKEFSYNNPIILGHALYGSDVISMYSPRHRKFLKIGNDRAFTKASFSLSCGTLNDMGSKYFTIAMSSNQIALVNMERLEPAVVADNGNAWFESIQAIGDDYKKDRRDKESYLPTIYSNTSKIYLLTYDSAADEKYIFDPITGTYGNVADFEASISENEELSGFKIVNESCLGSRRIPGYIHLIKNEVLRYEYLDDTYTLTRYAYININTKRPLEINGYKVFESVYCAGSLVGVLPDERTYGKQVSATAYFYDYITGKDLTINGETIAKHGYSVYLDYLGELTKDDNKVARPLKYLTIGDNKGKEYLVYNSLKHEFFEYNGNFVFGVDDRMEGIIRTENGEQLQLTNPEQDARKQEYAMQQAAESFKRKFNTLLEQMNRYNLY